MTSPSLKRDKLSLRTGRFVNNSLFLNYFLKQGPGRSLQTTLIWIAGKPSQYYRELKVTQVHTWVLDPSLMVLLDQAGKGEGSSGETTRDGDPSGNEKDKGADEGDRKIDKGPSVLSIDQSALTGESLAVNKCNTLLSCVHARAHTADTQILVTRSTIPRVRNAANATLLSPISQRRHSSAALRVSSPGARDRGISNASCQALGFHCSYCASSFLPVLGDNDPRAGVFPSVIIWLLAIWIGGFFRGVNIATPKDNNLLVYTLVLLVSVASFLVRRSFIPDRL